MTNAVNTLLALDVDGVVNHFSKSAKNSLKAELGGYPIRWRPEMLNALRERLSRPEVEGVWLTTWLSEPELLNELEKLMGLDGLMPHRAEYPHMVELGWGGVKTLLNPAFANTQLHPGNSRWWKYRSAELLLEKLNPKRFAWVDDDLGINAGRNDPWYTRNVTYERLLLKTHDVAGMLPEHLNALDKWLDMESP